ncbi:hypothetical protein SAMN05444414_1802 [Roseovarius marisflavi]|uniref:Uncharacterized protein n=1 Tax=Roseovarius marisflavi TaxID=1054996 RepID=A0A1M7E5J9_9RHOB|nr:hypothetical protein SAMN05444414_1802 [Roseovarius marisflavi]
MCPLFVASCQPRIQIDLQFLDRAIQFLAKDDVMELILDRPVEPLVYALGLRAVGFGSGVIHILNRQIKLIGVVLTLP